MRIVSPVGGRAANDAGPVFARASAAERRAADVFLGDLLGGRPPRARAATEEDDAELFWRDLIGPRG